MFISEGFAKLYNAEVGWQTSSDLSWMLSSRRNQLDIKIPWQAYICIGAALILTEVAHRLWQATFLEIGSASRFMRLEKKEHITLWNAILRSDLDTFSQVKEKLLLCTELLVFMLLSESETRCKIPDAMIFTVFWMSFGLSLATRKLFLFWGWCAPACRSAKAWLSDYTCGCPQCLRGLPHLPIQATAMSYCTKRHLWQKMEKPAQFGISWVWSCHRCWKMANWQKEWIFFCKAYKFRSRPHCFGLLFMPAIWITSFIWSLACQTSASGMSSDRSRARQLRLGCNDCN